MSSKKNVKEALAKSFKKLILEYPFEKITISMMTDPIGVIRPTFYNHFVDKYDLLEWVCYKDIFEKLEKLVSAKRFTEAIRLLFLSIEEQQEFYLKVVKIQGQNGFNDIFCKQITQLIEDAFENLGNKLHTHNKIFTASLMANYYAQCLTYMIEQWLIRGLPVTAEEITKAYYVLATTTMEDLLEHGYKG